MKAQGAKKSPSPTGSSGRKPLTGAPFDIDSDDLPDLDNYWAENALPPERDRADLPVLPPFIYAGALIISLFFELASPGDFFRVSAQITIGLAAIGAGAALLAWCLTLFADAETNVEPYRPTTALVKEGPYNYSRNPIYISLCIIYLGLCVLFDITWGFVFFPPMVATVHLLAVLPEEAYLEEKFGQKYRDYCKSVRRWL